MLVTRILGDCPKCKTNEAYGIVDVYRDHVLYGCGFCDYAQRYYLPPLRKAILYLDQFFFSDAFRGGDARFVDAANRVRALADKQLLVSPYSTIHADETHLWERRDELFAFIKSASRGHQFKAAYSVEREQVLLAFEAWLNGGVPSIDRRDVLEHDVDHWDSYFRIDVDQYHGDIDSMRRRKHKTVRTLVDAFPQWRKSTQTFEEDVDLEIHDTGRHYFETYFKFLERIGRGDYRALVDSPVASMIVQHMCIIFPKICRPTRS